MSEQAGPSRPIALPGERFRTVSAGTSAQLHPLHNEPELFPELKRVAPLHTLHTAAARECKLLCDSPPYVDAPEPELAHTPQQLASPMPEDSGEGPQSRALVAVPAPGPYQGLDPWDALLAALQRQPQAMEARVPALDQGQREEEEEERKRGALGGR